jgi:hypothetical protein
MSNQVHLRGFIGEASLQKVGNLDVARFTVATEFAYTLSGEGSFNVTEWDPCLALVSEKIPDLSIFVPHAEVEIKGRLIMCRFTDGSGVERRKMKVLAKEVSVVGPPISWQE